MIRKIALGLLFLIIFLATFLFFAEIAGGRIPVKEAEKGAISFRSENFNEDWLVQLGGAWEFYWASLLPPQGEATEAEGHFLQVPASWTSLFKEGKNLPAHGYGTYRLLLKDLPKGEILSIYMPEVLCAYKLFINGKPAAQNGEVGIKRSSSRPEFLPQMISFTPETDNTELLLHVSCFNYRKSGIWRNLILGSPSAVHEYKSNQTMTDTFLIGSLFIIGIYHLGIYAFRKMEKSALYFGLFCLLTVIRIATTGEQLGTYLYSFVSWELQRKAEFSLLVLGAPLFILFISELFPKEKWKKFSLYYLIQTGILALLTFLPPVRISNLLVIPLQVHMLIGVLYCLFIIFRGIHRKKTGAKTVLSGSLILIFGAVNDILYSNGIISGLYLIPTTLFLFIFFQTIMLSRRFSQSFNEVEKLSLRLSDLNKSLSRFVPFEFLDILSKESIVEINLGDQIQQNMTILFSDIRSFTELSESMSPQENFNFLNSYLHRIGPVIRKNSGFIDKYIGDAIMALFPSDPEKALKAAIEMRQEVNSYNKHRSNSGYPPIDIGIGIHIGDSILGTIGETNRLETTVIADAVNIASRLEALTKEFGVPIITTEDFVKELPPKTSVSYRRLGNILLKGKSRAVNLFEILDSYGHNEYNAMMKLKKPYEQALGLYEEGKIEEAQEAFIKLNLLYPQDGPTLYYIARCQVALNQKEADGFLEEL